MTTSGMFALGTGTLNGGGDRVSVCFLLAIVFSLTNTAGGDGPTHTAANLRLSTSLKATLLYSYMLLDV